MLKTDQGSRHRGVRPFGIGTETPMAKMVGVNLGCLA